MHRDVRVSFKVDKPTKDNSQKFGILLGLGYSLGHGWTAYDLSRFEPLFDYVELFF